MAARVRCIFGEPRPRSKGHSIHREAGRASQALVVSRRVGEALEGARDVDRRSPPVVATACAAAYPAKICPPGRAGGNFVRRAFARRTESRQRASMYVRGHGCSQLECASSSWLHLAKPRLDLLRRAKARRTELPPARPGGQVFARYAAAQAVATTGGHRRSTSRAPSRASRATPLRAFLRGFASSREPAPECGAKSNCFERHLLAPC